MHSVRADPVRRFSARHQDRFPLRRRSPGPDEQCRFVYQAGGSQNSLDGVLDAGRS